MSLVPIFQFIFRYGVHPPGIAMTCGVAAEILLLCNKLFPQGLVVFDRDARLKENIQAVRQGGVIKPDLLPNPSIFVDFSMGMGPTTF